MIASLRQNINIPAIISMGRERGAMRGAFKDGLPGAPPVDHRISSVRTVYAEAFLQQASLASGLGALSQH